MEEILFKVVTSHRHSIFNALWWRKLMPKEFSLTYKKETRVKAIEGSIGIACFDSLYNAENFVARSDICNSLILRVRPIGPVRIMETLPIIWYGGKLKSSHLTEEGERSKLLYVFVPDGTVFCDEVEILD